MDAEAERTGKYLQRPYKLTPYSLQAKLAESLYQL